MPHILRSSPPSPFGRKVKLAAYVTDLMHTLEVVPTDTLDPEDTIRQQNPLGKIPALLIEGGPTLYDSRVILEWIDLKARQGGHPGIIPAEETPRFAALTLQALADGMADAALLQVYEARMRPVEMHSEKWLQYQAEKVSRALMGAERQANRHPVTTAPVHVGQIALSCALGYLDLRFPNYDWRSAHPGLARWLEDFAAAVPAYETTRFKG